MNNSTVIPITIFHSQVILIYADSLEDCSKIAREMYNLDVDYSSGHLAITQEHGHSITICLPQYAYLQDESILVHETNHAAFAILRYIGDSPCSANEEVICYLQQYIYKECKKTLNALSTSE